MDQFLDSSALVKRHVSETGSDWVRRRCATAQARSLHVARVVVAEVTSALCRRCREGSLTAAERDALITGFAECCEREYKVWETTRAVVTRATVLLKMHPLRAYDAVQLATALRVSEGFVRAGLPPLTFVSADERLCECARAEGLSTENPNNYPSHND
ncbi:MAG: VapC toxin family PIN domain ribonuclease [Armatimonadetes bacterium CG_4_10_14_3_um_filter_66_18]|nr:type II toxin-antitoxin system VapC family toxin [Armatimonadota bacterium]PIX40177.1 MAG: VapC toxin family PIN domain ribonuclease [Armatimonadetes bacterium CG_4_8_14_3_um_filter_66_20]PIY41058.1 MAG: VapC toxin family PIN domain ribonuclease [Armatimonadetes bacterium CG_4_10_14_3_um_filter_66_18]PIZ50342.1 MAG: VapC toxin family PIN domain ribonuclease [Armatimonadetes bacterium CG_4_10_14_0_8_um_filter_66_14]PJB67566.1 MAG: VapC toxin family PIN domain ribonuclease [Armatimonadetes bac